MRSSRCGAALGGAEFRRIESLAVSMRRDGYLRRSAAVQQVVLMCGDGFLAVMNGGGVHRPVAAAAVGLPTIPARPWAMVDIDDVEAWASVKSGLWSAGRARAFCAHLFDLDFSGWAHELGLSS